MRCMMKISINTEAGNRCLRDGNMPKVMKNIMETVRPESAYFTVENGKRTAFLFCDMKESSSMVSMGENAFMELGADISITPCMNQEELQQGLAAWGKNNR